MKFRVRFYEDKWNGRTCSTGRQIKQKTFYAKDWDEAELVGQQIGEKLYEERGKWFACQMSVLR